VQTLLATSSTLILNPPSRGSTKSYDVASNICQTLEMGLTLYEQAFNEAPYNCYCADVDTLCNQCLTTQQGMQITRKTPTNAFTAGAYTRPLFSST